MKQLIFEYNMKLSFSENVKEQHFQLRCIPQETANQHVVDYQYVIYPMDTFTTFYDGFGNLTLAGNAIIPHKEFRFSVKGIVECNNKGNRTKEECHPIFSYPTKLTEYSSDMEFLIPKEKDDFVKMILELNSNIFNTINYKKASTNNFTTAIDVINTKEGVCQDFSHLMIAILKHMGYPARYVAGMINGEGETHAWIEVYYGDSWFSFDPTNNKIVDDNYIVLAKGRDFNDTVIDKGIFFGNATQKQEVYVSVK